MEYMKKTKDKDNSSKKENVYKIKNWTEYNTALKQRGSITLWIDEDVMGWWNGEGRYTYSNRAIEVMMILGNLYHQPLRGITGFVTSLFKQLGIPLSVPDYTTISRRADTLDISLRKRTREATDIILDSTGVKIYGEGEWKRKKHGFGTRRRWRKIHLGIASDGEIRAVEVTDEKRHDSTVITDILQQEQGIITNFYGDGAYDTSNVYWSLIHKGVTGFHIPPRKDAKIQLHGNTKRPPWPRDVMFQ